MFTIYDYTPGKAASLFLQLPAFTKKKTQVWREEGGGGRGGGQQKQHFRGKDVSQTRTELDENLQFHRLAVVREEICWQM
jgi:hypothetical protein